MKKQVLICLLSAFIMGSSAFYLLREPSAGTFKLEDNRSESKSGISKIKNAREAAQWRLDRLKDENGNFDPSYFIRATKQADQMKQRSSRSGLGLQWEELGPDNVGGRTRAILVDKRDPSNNTVYAGGVCGGMWKSTDGAQNWSRLTGWNQWLAVSCIAQGPDNKIWIGTGEGLGGISGSSLNSGSVGDGIYNLDANDNPLLASPEAYPTLSINGVTSPWAAVNRIAVNPTNQLDVIAATAGGLWRTQDGGSTWVEITLPAPIGRGSSCSDVKWSNDGSVIYASAYGNRLLVMSPSGGASWNIVLKTTNPGFPFSQSSPEGRIEIAMAPSNSDVVYISMAQPNGCTFGVYKTSNASNPNCSWISIASKGPLFDPFVDGECQGWYDNTIAVNPFNPDKVYLGGVNFYTYSSLVGWNLADAGLGGGAVNPYYIHPDKHTIVFAQNDSNLMYVGCDGGIYKSVDAAKPGVFPFPTFSVKNKGYNVTQNYGVAAALTGEVIGGSQDNGTNYVNFLGNTKMAGQEVIGGDGIFTAVSHIDQGFYFGGVYYADVERSGNHAASFNLFYDIKINPSGINGISACGGTAPSGNAPFITPFYLGETKAAANGLKTVVYHADATHNSGDVVQAQSATANYPFNVTLPQSLNTGDTMLVSDPVRSRMFVTSFCGVWVTPDPLNLAIIPRWFKLINLSTSDEADAYASTADGDILYVGTATGTVYRFNHLNAICDTAHYLPGVAVTTLYPNSANYTTSNLAGSIEGIAVDPADNNHIAAAISGFSASNRPHVYESHDGGAHWKPDTAGLPNMPVYSIIIHGSNIIIGSELGMWSYDGTQWNEENNNFPRMPVYRMIETNLYSDGCPVIYLGTHGRGMWRCTTLTPSACQTSVGTGVNNIKPAQLTGLSIYPNPVHSTAKISLNIDKTTHVTLRVFDMTGRLHREVTYKNTLEGDNLFDLDATGLSAGTYLLSATADDRTQSRLFVVTK